MIPQKISMWSGPRNLSTAMMYSFSRREDINVIDEPLYGYYLDHTDVNHPGKQELKTMLEKDPQKVIIQLQLYDSPEKFLFLKNMAHHIIDLDLEFILEYKNFILIRNPEDVIRSLLKKIENPVMRDTGFQQLDKIYNFLIAHGVQPAVVDAELLLKNPEKVLSILCEAVGIPFDPVMLSWPKGGIPEDGPWAKYWYHNVHQSTGFVRFQKSQESLPDQFNELLGQCKTIYDALYENAIRPE